MLLYRKFLKTVISGYTRSRASDAYKGFSPCPTTTTTHEPYYVLEPAVRLSGEITPCAAVAHAYPN